MPSLPLVVRFYLRLRAHLFISLLLFLSSSHARQGNATQFEDGLKTVNGVELYYKVMGKGSPLVVLHGGPGLEHSYFLPHLARLAEHHRVVFFDQRANGRSAAPKDTSAMTLDQYVEDLEELRKELGIQEKMALLGHSWGALIAMRYAIKYPEALSALILVNPVAASSQYRAQSMRRMQSRMTPADSLTRLSIMQSEPFRRGSPVALEQFFKVVFRPTLYDRKNIEKLRFQFPPDYAAKSAMLQYMREMLNYDIHRQLSAITAPTLIIHGDVDPLPLEAVERLHESITNSKLVIMNDSGHFPFIEKPEELFRLLEGFLNRTPSQKE